MWKPSMNSEGWRQRSRDFFVQLLHREVSRVGMKMQPGTWKCVVTLIKAMP